MVFKGCYKGFPEGSRQNKVDMQCVVNAQFTVDNKLDRVVPLVVDPPRWNLTTMEILHNPTKLP